MKTFKSERKYEDVSIDERVYRIREFGGTELSAYMADMGKRMKYGADGKPVGMSSYEDIESGLVARCLHEQKDGQWVKVELTKVKSWSSSTIKALYAICQQINGMGDEATAAAKKDSPPTEDGMTSPNESADAPSAS